jgi:hypothetical protein
VSEHPTLQTPEHDKREAFADREQEIRSFLEWIGRRGFDLCEFDEMAGLQGRFDTIKLGTEELIAEYLGFDLQEIERERRMILHLARQSNEVKA